MAENNVKTIYISGRKFSVDFLSDKKGGQWWEKVNSGKWEPQTFNIFDRLLLDGSTYIDFGAWVGVTTLYCAHTAAKVYAFEPDPVSFSALKDNILLNPVLCDKIELRNVAIGCVEKTVPIYNKSPGTSASTLLNTNVNNEVRHFSNVSVIDTRTFLSSIDMSNVSLIKMDIEGGEFEVLPHISDVIRQFKPNLHLSFHAKKLEKMGKSKEEIENIGENVYNVIASYKFAYRFNRFEEKLIRLNNKKEKTEVILSAGELALSDHPFY